MSQTRRDMQLKAAVLALLLSVCAFATDVTGKWNAIAKGPGGDIGFVFTITQTGTKLTGSAHSQLNGDVPIKSGKVQGDAISFTVQNDQFKAVHKGTVSGDEMKLTVEISGQKMEMMAKREK